MMESCRQRFGLAIVLVLGIVAFGWGSAVSAQSSQPVLLELFTSQGCPACPRAEAFLSELKDREDLVTMAWHVDYWDDKGWVDPFSNKAFSQRQITYAKAFQSERIFTPQMVVDGHTSFNGSDRDEAYKAIAEAGSREKSRVFLVVKPIEGSPNMVAATVRFERGAVVGPSSLAGVILAVTEDNLSVTIEFGENGGRTLRHDAVVRWARIAGETAGDVLENTVRVRLRRSWKRDDLHLIAFVQDSRTQRILAVRSVDISEALSDR